MFLRLEQLNLCEFPRFISLYSAIVYSVVIRKVFFLVTICVVTQCNSILKFSIIDNREQKLWSKSILCVTIVTFGPYRVKTFWTKNNRKIWDFHGDQLRICENSRENLVKISKVLIFRKLHVWEMVKISRKSRFLGNRMFWKLSKFPESPDFLVIRF